MIHAGQNPPGSQLGNGRYRIEGMVGKGGMGYVYKARDIALGGRIVAVKEMQQQNLTTKELDRALVRFNQEAEMLKKLAHPNIPRFYDAFSEGGRSYLVMDFIEGKTLQELIENSPMRRLPAGKVLKYARQLCDVLSYLHSQRPDPIVFRDLKPLNVMVAANDRLYLIDFGIARFFKYGQLQDTELFGSIGFRSPELINEGRTSPRSDLFSLGATLHYCLTGHHPQDNKPNFFVFADVRNYNVQVSVNLANLILQLVATEEHMRPDSADEVLERIKKIQKEAAGATTSVNSGAQAMGSYYNPRVAMGAQIKIWLLSQISKLPDRLNRWGIFLRPLLIKLVRGVSLWVLLTLWPFCLMIVGQIGRIFIAAGNWLKNPPTRAPKPPRPFPKPPGGGKGGLDWKKLGQGGVFPAGWLLAVPRIRERWPVLVASGLCLIGSVYMLLSLKIAQQMVLFLLGIVLLTLLFVASFSKRLDYFTRALLAATNMALIAFCVALVVQPAIQDFLATITLSTIVSVALIALCITSWLRTYDRLLWCDHVLLIGIAAICGLLQYTFGSQMLSQIAVHSPDSYDFINFSILLLLAGVIFVSLLRMFRHYQVTDRILVGVVALIFLGQQCFLGIEALKHLPVFSGYTEAGMTSLLIVSMSLLLALLPLAVLFFSSRVPSDSRKARAPLACLGITVALLQQLLGSSLSLSILSSSYSLHTAFLEVVPPIQLLIYSLALVALILFLCLLRRANVPQIDYVALLSLAVLCTILQFSLSQEQFQSLMSAETSQIFSSLSLYIIASSALITFFVAIMIIAIFMLCIFSLFSSMKNSHLSTDGEVTRLDQFMALLGHGMLLGSILICIFLQSSAGMNEPWYDQIPILLDNNQVIYLAQVLFWVSVGLAILTFICLFLVYHRRGPVNKMRPFSWVVRAIIIVCILVYILMLQGKSTLSEHLSQLWHIGSTLSIPLFVSKLALLILAIISLLWLRKSFLPNIFRILRIVFGFVLGCALLQFLWSFFSVMALLMLIPSVLLVLQLIEEQ